MTRRRDNIVLIGFASTGKSTTGQVLASQLGWEFIDLDDVVERLHIEERGVKRRCREIFSLFGRECFVNYESRAIDALSTVTHAVIATGGGTPIAEINRERTRDLGVAVYLNASVSAIFERMSVKGFPQYLSPSPSLEKLRQLWLERDAIYRQVADLIIDNSAMTPKATATRIVQYMKSHEYLNITRD